MYILYNKIVSSKERGENMRKRYKILFMLIIATIIFNTATTVKAVDCYKNWYVYSSGCSNCDDSTYSSSQRDNCSGKHKRQNGIKLCSLCLSGMSSCATYYKCGFSDYNCLAYALGKNTVQSWTWPASWGYGPTLTVFKSWIKAKGYTCTTDMLEVKGNQVILVYVNNGKVVHFARTRTLDGNSIAGAKTISKWGACSLYTTSKLSNPYKSTSGYGSLKLYCYK